MKPLQKFLVFTFFLALTSIFPVRGFSSLGDGFTPSHPPNIPIADYAEKSESEVKIDFLSYSNDDIDMKGIGAGYNYISPFGASNAYVFNIGLAATYMTAETDTLDGDGFSIPVNANIGMRLSGTHDKPGAVLFAGAHFAFTHIYVGEAESTNIEVNVFQKGPLFGIMGEFAMSENMKFIPFYVLRVDFVDVDIWVNGNYYAASDSAVSHLIGFDLEINNISIGTVLDMINNTDGTLIAITLGVKF